MDKEAVNALVKNNLAKYQVKWDKERVKLLAFEINLVNESFDNAYSELSLRNTGLRLTGMAPDYQILRVGDWDAEGKYRDGARIVSRLCSLCSQHQLRNSYGITTDFKSVVIS
ncbi:Fe-S cluster assembly ATPase SufC [Sesbania bispinosa]|nr:Fe-S cluster assembly ATPase SufC [Sesbania bispinosa]